MKQVKTLKGAASFYVVAFSTLILVIIATSFATVILSQVARSMNDDLSQSAYDSALAGVEDAKLAYANYRRCISAGKTAASVITQDGVVTCEEIIYWMEHPNCDMVGHILGRLPDNQESGEVEISDTIATNNGDVENNLNQAYTCVEIKTLLSDYRATLTSSNQVRAVKAEFENMTAEAVKTVRLSWYANSGNDVFHYNNFVNGRVAFMPATSASVATPPTIELQMVQTAERFTFDKVVSKSVGNTTDRATMYFVPINDCNSARSSGNTYTGLETGNCTGTTETHNQLSSAQVAKTNDQTIKNLPFGVWCPSNGVGTFMCSVDIELPSPIAENETSSRNNDTFMLMVTLPYGQPDTDFSLEYYSTSDRNILASAYASNYLLDIHGVQVEIDSTGRANDLYRRVEARLESSDVSFPYPYYAMELLGGSNQTVLEKNMTVTSEYNDYR